MSQTLRAGYDATQLADLEEIRALSHRYGLALDRFDLEGVMAVFTPEAVFDASAFGLGALEGGEAIRHFFEHNEETMENQMHSFSNHIIEFDGPDEARGTNYLFEDGHNKNGQRIKVLGLNEDRYVRTENGWRIAYRKISPLLPPQLEGYQD